MNVLVVSGIWPPDVGGPATHAPELAAFLHGRGHRVEVVVTADTEPAQRPYPIRYTPRRLPKGVRHLHGLALIARRASAVDVVYTTGMFGRSGIACTIARRPYVVKLTGDPAFERLRARGAVVGDVDAFQRGGGGFTGRALRRLRDAVVRRAAHVFVPSAYLAEIVSAWGVQPARVSVLPNPAPSELPTTPREALRDHFDLSSPTLVFAGRLTAQKSLDVLLEAVAAVEGIELVIAGDGEERLATERRVAELALEDRVRLTGALPRAHVLELLAAGDVSVLSSAWENFPHGVVESLAVGTPVIATGVGGVTEVVRDGENGLLVPPGDAPALAEAIRRFLDDDALRERLRAAAAPSVEHYASERLLAAVERALAEAAR